MLQTVVKNLLLPFQDFVVPPVCFTCDRLRADRSSKICAECWNALTPITPAHPTWGEIGDKLCREGLVEDLLSCFLFEKEGKIQEVVHLLKYGGVRSIGVELGRILGRRVMRDPRYAGAAFLVPVPLHRTKLRERGYNQSEYLCRGISAVTRIPVHATLLRRKKYTASQTRLSLDERRENVRDAFVLNHRLASAVENTTLVLVDDVITTGATLQACAQELRQSGAASVFAASVALGQ